MKCGYKYCKNGGVVSKEEGIKDGKRYYCKDCFNKKNTKSEIEKYYIDNIDKRVMLTLLRNAIKQLVDDKEYEADLVLYMIKWVVSNKQKINNPNGLNYYISNEKMLDAYKSEILSKKGKEVLKEIEDNIIKNKDVQFKYNPSNPKWMDIVKSR